MPIRYHTAVQTLNVKCLSRVLVSSKTNRWGQSDAKQRVHFCPEEAMRRASTAQNPQYIARWKGWLVSRTEFSPDITGPLPAGIFNLRKHTQLACQKRVSLLWRLFTVM